VQQPILDSLDASACEVQMNVNAATRQRIRGLFVLNSHRGLCMRASRWECRRSRTLLPAIKTSGNDRTYRVYFGRVWRQSSRL